MVLVQNLSFLHVFILGNISQENVFYDILERKNYFLGYKNKKFKKSKNCHFLKEVNPWFWSKNGHFSFFFFSLKSRKIEVLPKGLTHGFGLKLAIFSTFFLGNISQKYLFYDILERKNTFQGYKNTKFKKSKN